MAINPETQYPGKIAPSTPDYPYGAARNITNPGDGTGTPWEAALVNDLFGFQQAALKAADIAPSGNPEKVGASQYLTALLSIMATTVETTAAITTTNLTNQKVIRTGGFEAIGDGMGSDWVATGNTGTPATTDYANGLIYDSKGNEFKKTEVRGGVFMVFDDATATTKSDLLPIARSNNFKTGLAMYLSGLASSYNVVKLEEAQEFIKDVGGEVLNHSSNSVVLNAGVDQTYGETLIRTAKDRLSQFGFEVGGFVAPSSTLDAKFTDETERRHDFAFVRSVAVTTKRSSVNRPEDNKFNLVRVALESITLQDAKDLVDYAIATDSFVVFYTHTDTGFVSDLMAYVNSSLAPNITASEWAGGVKGLAKIKQPVHGGNLLVNSRFKKLADADASPFGWSVDLSALDGASFTLTPGESGEILDAISGAGNAGGEIGVVAQNYFIDPIKTYTPFVASINASSLATSNTQLEVAVYAKAGAATVASSKTTYDISSNEQRIFATLGVLPDVSIDRILVEYNIVAKAAGAVRAILSEPQLERAGFPTAYSARGIDERYYSVMRRTSGLTVNPGVDVDVVFNASLEGTNLAYDDTTGVFRTDDNRLYTLTPNVGLQGMAAGDHMQLQLQIDGAVSRKHDQTCVAGTNLANTSFQVRGDGREYKISIRHDGAGGKSITTFGDATLTIAHEGDTQ